MHKHFRFALTSGRGKIIIASSEATAVSKEKIDCRHVRKDIPHAHGAFTFHLIEGLYGKAADSDTGVITIGSIRKYIEDKMISEGKQRPYIAQTSSGILDIKIAVSQTQFNKKISQLIEDADQSLNEKIGDSGLVDIQMLTEVVKKISKLRSLDSKNKEIPRLIRSIDDALRLSKK